MATKIIKPRIQLTNVYGTKSVNLDQYPPEAWDWLTGDADKSLDKQDIATLWASVPWLYRGVDKIATGVTSIPFGLENKAGKEITHSADWQDPTGYLPNPKRMLRQISASLTLEGRAYLFRDQAKTINAVKRLQFWKPTSVTLDLTKAGDGELVFLRPVKSVAKEFTVDQVIYFFPPDAYTEIGPGSTSPAKAALAAAGTLYYLDQYLAAYWARGAIKAMVLSIKGGGTQAEKDKLKEWFKKLTGGVQRAFDTLTLNAEQVTPTIIGDGLEGLQNSGLTAQMREDISTALGIPQTILFSTGAGGLGGGGVVQEDTFRLYNETVVPQAEFIVDVLNEQQLKAQGFTLKLHPEEMDVFQEDEAARAAAFSAYAAHMPARVAMDILGIEISEEAEAMWVEKEKIVLPAPVAPVVVAPPPVEVPPAKTVDPSSTLELQRWERKIIKAKKPVEFKTYNLPEDIAERLRNKLKGYETDENFIKAAFEQAHNELKSAPPDNGALAVLEGIRLGVEALKFNPNHDEAGRFSSGEGGGSGGAGEEGGGGSGGDGGGQAASTEQAIEIIKMQGMGAPPAHIEEMLRENGVDYVEAYHVTSVGNMEFVEENGIRVSYQENRPDASYFFLDKADVGRNADILGQHGEYAIVTIRIPRSEAANVMDDGFFNGTFPSSYSAARYPGSIPPDWILGVSKQTPGR